MDTKELEARQVVQELARNKVVDEFHKLWYMSHNVTWNAARYLGIPIQKNPMDLFVLQEIFWDLKPSRVIETGTFYGGSALYMAHLLDAIGKGKVLSIDINQKPPMTHPRIEFYTGDSVASSTIEKVQEFVSDADGPVLVILDSDHSCEHVFKELQHYHQFVTPSSYLIVEDTNVSGKPVFNPEYAKNGGPFPAVQTFLALHQNFRSDIFCEHFLFSCHPDGWLKRMS